MSGSEGRLCSGTRRRAGVYVDGDCIMRADAAVDGCGHEVVLISVPPSAAPGDERPLFVRDAPAVICPFCDTGDPGPDAPWRSLAGG